MRRAITSKFDVVICASKEVATAWVEVFCAVWVASTGFVSCSGGCMPRIIDKLVLLGMWGRLKIYKHILYLSE